MLDLSRFAYKKKQKSTGSEKPSNEVVTPNNAHTTDAVVTVVPETPLSVIRKAPNTLNNGKKKGKRVLHSSSFSEDSDQRDSEGNEDSRTRTLTGPVAAPRSIFEGFKTCKRQKRSVGSSQNAADENLQEAVVAMSCTHSPSLLPSLPSLPSLLPFPPSLSYTHTHTYTGDTAHDAS